LKLPRCELKADGDSAAHAQHTKDEVMTHVVAILAVGTLMGWLASACKPSETLYSVLINVVVGIFGAGLGAWLAAPIAGWVPFKQADFSGGVLLISLTGAVVLLVLTHWIARIPPRP
jgi:uncharacterized membrane protein YeaQ/YmgE (transglycosylase-associated protein family)